MTERTCSIPECEKPARKRGWCQMHYWRFRKYGSTDNPRPTFEERFWAKVDKSGGEGACWLWVGAMARNGYGKFGVGGRGSGWQPAHRVAYSIAAGEIPEGMVIDHRCWNRACVNPAHLQAVTAGQNNENRMGADRDNVTRVRGVSHCRRSGLYVVQVGVNGEHHHGGRFATLEEAEAEAVALRLRLMTNNLGDRAS